MRENVVYKTLSCVSKRTRVCVCCRRFSRTHAVSSPSRVYECNMLRQVYYFPEAVILLHGGTERCFATFISKTERKQKKIQLGQPLRCLLNELVSLLDRHGNVSRIFEHYSLDKLITVSPAFRNHRKISTQCPGKESVAAELGSQIY